MTLPRLIAKHRRTGLLVDTNLLLLLWIGTYERDRIRRFKRTSQFTETDFDLLFSLVAKFDRLITTPNILTELSNLSGHLEEPLRSRFRIQAAEAIDSLEERYVAARESSALESFPRLGLTDASVESIAAKGTLVITDDLGLYLQLSGLGHEVINFTHYRAGAYGWVLPSKSARSR